MLHVSAAGLVIGAAAGKGDKHHYLPVFRSGELVTKQELMDRVWPKLYVQPASLTVHISALRRVLRDGRDGNRFIINIPGRGYCFVAATRWHLVKD